MIASAIAKCNVIISSILLLAVSSGLWLCFLQAQITMHLGSRATCTSHRFEAGREHALGISKHSVMHLPI